MKSFLPRHLAGEKSQKRKISRRFLWWGSLLEMTGCAVLLRDDKKKRLLRRGFATPRNDIRNVRDLAPQGAYT